MECKFSTKAHPCFNTFRKMFYDEGGKKIIKTSTLGYITHPLALATWFGDDGSNDKWDYRLATANFSVKEIKLLIRWLKRTFGIKSSLHKHGKYWYVSIRKDKLNFKRLIRLYLPKVMSYKIN